MDTEAHICFPVAQNTNLTVDFCFPELVIRVCLFCGNSATQAVWEQHNMSEKQSMFLFSGLVTTRV